ncbi:unnamed protein product [Vitrella brassicaformis CCMP3155]|uniref:Uncharacterized protein n=2 Tax=Vitrella brassicaformis TaxID=1169539 RepID=A0A0G4FFK0_VITBC|nr:unnamed protein product [Vitrella brassicaformis CCMP3155]|eukprot:CEM11812.1 unnamed protein product [Vitrella brassicaformis CCMP3155]
MSTPEPGPEASPEELRTFIAELKNDKKRLTERVLHLERQNRHLENMLSEIEDFNATLKSAYASVSWWNAELIQERNARRKKDAARTKCASSLPSFSAFVRSIASSGSRMAFRGRRERRPTESAIQAPASVPSSELPSTAARSDGCAGERNCQQGSGDLRLPLLRDS